MYRKAFLAAGLALTALSTAYGQTPAGLPPGASRIDVKPLRGGVYWVEGGIANSGFIVGDKGVVVIDAQMFPDVARKVLAEIAQRTSKPVTDIILTHSDPDHVLGLSAFPAGTPVIAQEHAKTEMQAASAAPQASAAAQALKDHLPTRMVAAREDVVLAGVRMTLLHTAGAHTDGDLAVYLPAQKIVFAGDLATPAIGAYPGIHLCKHGSSLGWIQSVEAILALDADLYVSGHGAPLTRADLQARVDAARQRRAQIQALVDEGKSLADVKAALHDAPLPGVAARFPTFVETTYQELTNTQPDCGAPRS